MKYEIACCFLHYVTSNKCPVRLVCCCDKSPLQVSLLSNTPKPREGWRFWRKHRLDDQQHLDKKEPIGSWDEFVQPSADASSALRKLDAMSEVWQSSNWKWVNWCGIKGKENRGRIKLQKELIQHVLELWRIKKERGKATCASCFSILVYCHSQSPTETVLQTSPTCRARSNWAHHTAVWPCTPLPNPSFPTWLTFKLCILKLPDPSAALMCWYAHRQLVRETYIFQAQRTTASAQ